MPLLLVAAGLITWSPTTSVVAGRVRRLAGSTARPRVRARRRRSLPPVPPGARRWLTAATAALAVAVLVGGAWAVPLGLLAAAVVDPLLRRSGRPEPALRPDLAVVCDLLGVCLDAGTPPAAALASVAEAVPGPLGSALGRVAGLYRLGAEPVRAWADVPGELHGLARVFVRAGETGSAVGPALRALAVDARVAARGRIDVAVQRAGVWVLLPLGACFLPAFVCLGVVPLVLGIARGVFG